MQNNCNLTGQENMLKKIGLISAAISVFAISGIAFAANQATINQAINDGTKSVDIVDAGGTTVASPSVSFGNLSFSFNTQDGAGVLGTASQAIRTYNPTSGATWSVSIAASAPTAVWTSGGNTYDFNDTSGYTDGVDTDTKGGQMTIDPSAGTIAGVAGCLTSNISKGASTSFVETTTNSIGLMTAAAGAPTYCRWDLTGINLTNKIPAAQPSGSYALTLVLTVV
ncbi:MAG: hypothetical protein US57_C0004G0010 [Candidatus Moranbacteria bacterium GW2011_GWC2_37_73]|nr:MAG: hypothetical protein UR95_C0002G0090 [Parcubacteria group bacterium GW2011_GWC1_36_108]KKQ01067.1 MAG: hypothetical protein US09_C0003G0067 [Candidatus Moranbacteria bacterium GW2011_GWD1_36_198]KKQ02469.1 MAG: hypothetical protein US10_C0001G0067 [Candidatus Moranbacteria bacterium GW2011_GWD2_36_198]KKQ40127.1 MAG: hypothetical protein US57_C0004G0010 [Candidatus Moranbacteria bacterium GW2011_GWC2_37_73]